MYNRSGCGGGAELSAVISIAIIPAFPTHLDPGSCCCAQLSISYLTQLTHTQRCNLSRHIHYYSLSLSAAISHLLRYSRSYYNRRVIHRWMKGIQLFFPYLARDIHIYIYNALSHIKIYPPTRPSSRILSLGKSLRPNGFRVNRERWGKTTTVRAGKWENKASRAGWLLPEALGVDLGAVYRDFLLSSLGA